MTREFQIPGKRLSVSELLIAWEQGTGKSLGEQALGLLIASSPEVPSDRVAKLSFGQRDACLLTLREWTFGPRLEATAVCPSCSERWEISFDVADMRLGPSKPLISGDSDNDLLGPHTTSVNGHEVIFRLPNSLDLQTAGRDGLDALWRGLLERCVLTAYQDGEIRQIDELPAEVVQAVTARMDQLDPQANIELTLSCASCGHQWQVLFDVASFFWAEIRTWAHRILRDVHTLASAYAWSEVDILAMSPSRREVYLRMVGE